MKNMQLGQRYHFWLNTEDERFCLALHAILPGGKVVFVMEWKTKTNPPRPAVYMTVDRSHVTARAR